MFIGKPSRLTDDSPCPVQGRHYQCPMKDVPASFLDWFRGQPHLMNKYPSVAEYIQRMSTVINWELKKEEEE